MAACIQQWERSGWSCEITQTLRDGQAHYEVWSAVFDGMRWQSKRQGSRTGYKSQRTAQRIFDAYVAGVDTMLTKQGR